jgi:hypothetical protein
MSNCAQMITVRAMTGNQLGNTPHGESAQNHRCKLAAILFQETDLWLGPSPIVVSYRALITLASFVYQGWVSAAGRSAAS